MKITKNSNYINLCFIFLLIWTTGESRESLWLEEKRDNITNHSLFCDTMYIEIDRTVSLCPGRKFNYKGKSYGIGRMFSDTIEALQGCDTILHFSIIEKPSTQLHISGDDSWCAEDTAVLTVETSAQLWFWSTGEKTKTIRVSDPGIYWVEAFSSTECPSRDTIITEEYANPDVLITVHPETCDGDADGRIVILPMDPMSEKLVYIISGDTSPTPGQNDLSSGVYHLEIINENGCHLHDTILIEPGANLNIGLGPDLRVQSTDTVITLQVSSNGTLRDSIMWWLDDQMLTHRESQLDIVPTSSHTVRAKATNTLGCMAFDTVIIFLDVPNEIFAPNAFSPNGDGLNDFWRPFPSDPSLIISEIQIFNRWGEMLVGPQERSIITDGWDGRFNGKECSADVYVYFVEYIHPDLGRQQVRGSVTLVR